MKFSFTRLKGMPSVALLAMACSAFGGVASAATATWTGSGSNSLWSTNSNWGGNAGAGPVSGSNMIFSGSLRLTSTNDITTTTGSISFLNSGSTAAGFVLSGNSLALTNAAVSRISTAGLLGSGTVTETIGMNLAMGGAGLTLAPAGSAGRAHDLLISGNIVNGTGTTNNNVTIANGTGAQVILSGTNTNTGTYIVSPGGILTTTGSVALSGQQVNNNGTVNVNGSVLNVGPLATGTGVFTSSTAGLHTLNVAIANTSPGVSATSSFGGTITNGAGNLAFSKSGSSLFTLTGSNSYTGGSTVSGGTLKLGNNNALGNGAVALTGTSAVLDLDSRNVSVTSLTGTAGSQIVSSTPNANLTIDPGTSSTFAGRFSGANPIGVTKTGTGSQTLSGNNTGIGTLAVSNGLLNLTGSNSGITSATVSGGTLGLGNANALGASTAVVVNSGKLDVTTSSTIGSLSGSGGLISNSGTGSSVLTVNQTGFLTYAGVIEDGSGTLGLTKTGTNTLALTGANTYTGDTTVDQGTLNIGNNGTTGSINSASVVTISGSGILAYQRTDQTTFANTLNGVAGGQFNLTGAAITTITSTGNFAGNINDGAGSNTQFDGTLANAQFNVNGNLYGSGTLGSATTIGNAVISAGNGWGASDIGKLTINSLTLQEASTLSFQIAGSGSSPTLPGTAGVDYDTIVGSGALDYGSLGTNISFDFSGVTDAVKNWSQFQLLNYAGGTINEESFNADGSQFSSIGNGSGLYDSLVFTVADQTRGIFIADAGNGQTVEFYASTGVLMIVPEPSSIILAGLGVGLAGFRTWRNRRLKAILNRAGSKA